MCLLANFFWVCFRSINSQIVSTFYELTGIIENVNLRDETLNPFLGLKFRELRLDLF
jgi:hypothetical protein